MQLEVCFHARACAAMLAMAAFAPTYALAQDPDTGMTTVVPGEERWESPRDMPSGMRVMLLSGDPAMAGPYVYRVRVPSGYKWPPMKHPDSRVTTVLKGRLWVAEGSRYDATQMTELEVGATFVTPAGTPHYQWARTEVLLQVVGTGPIDEPVASIDPDHESWRLIMRDVDAVAALDLQWSESRSIPAGSRTITLYGDPGKPGPYIFRVRFPAGYKLPAHRHTDRRSVTVLEGGYWSGVGESFDPAELRRFGPRDYYITDAGVPHFAWAETEVVIQEMGIGPVGNPIQYVNPADDPRR